MVTEKSIAILKSNLKILEKNLNDAKKIYENGFNEQEDVEQLEITYGTLKNQLNNMPPIFRSRASQRHLASCLLGSVRLL